LPVSNGTKILMPVSDGTKTGIPFNKYRGRITRPKRNDHLWPLPKEPTGKDWCVSCLEQ